MADWLIKLLVNWSIDWLFDRLIVWLIDTWLIDTWLIDWLRLRRAGWLRSRIWSGWRVRWLRMPCSGPCRPGSSTTTTRYTPINIILTSFADFLTSRKNLRKYFLHYFSRPVYIPPSRKGTEPIINSVWC